MKNKNSVYKAILFFLKVLKDFVKKRIAASHLIYEGKLSLTGKLVWPFLIILFGMNAYPQSYTISAYNGQTVTTCTGIFYDSGGFGDDYGNNENFTVSFCSGNGNAVKFDFSSLDIRSGDTLYVYDGPDTTSPLMGKYSNALLPLSLISSATCMTFRFISNGIFIRSGWAANISCCPPPVTSPILPSDIYQCAGSTVNYSVNFHAGATYNWTVTNGTPASIIGGTNNLDITWDIEGDETGFIKVVEINSCGSRDSSIRYVDIYSLPVVDLSGLNAYYCIYSPPAVLTGSPSGGVFSGPGISGSTFTPSVAGEGTHNITYTYTDPSTGCTNLKTIQTIITVPDVFIVGASSNSYCSGFGVSITLSGSESGVSYQLLKNGVNDGSPLPGTGSPLTWPNRQNGVYTVVAVFDISSCSNNMSGSQIITENPLPVPTFTAQPGATTCSSTAVTYTTQPGQSNYIWGFTGSAGTDYSISAGGGLTDNSVTLMWLTSGSKSVTINYTNPNGCTAVTPVSSNPTVVTLSPPAPTGTAVQNFCSAASPTVASLTATGTAIRWYAAASGGAPLIATTPLSDNTHYYASQTVAGCESILRFDVTAFIFSIPLPPVPGAGTGATCSQITANWAASIGASSYRLDVSTVNTFITFVAGYQDRNVGNVTTFNVTGLTAGVTYYYRVRAVNFCGTSGNSPVITYSTLPATPAVPGAITGTAMQCAGLTGQFYSIASVPAATTYTWAVPAGWSITAGQGTITITVTTGGAGQNGNITVTAGNVCGTSTPSILAVTVMPPAGITSVTGTTPLCIGATATYVANGVVLSGGSGAWSSSNPAIATVSAAGLVTGVSAGTCNIIYTITGGCGGIKSAQQAVTITPNASITSVTGLSPICIGGATTYTANGVVLGGGTGAWSSSNPAVATVSAAGVVTGISAGTSDIIYSITGGCGGPVSAPRTVTVSPNASITSVTGLTPLCIGGTAPFSANGVVLSGGTGAWSSSNAAVASVSAAGLVTGVSAGTCNIIYTITGGCGGTVSAQQTVTVNPDASVASVTGSSPLCLGATAAYTANGVVTGGGTGAWSSSNAAIATVSAAGLVTGVSPGTCNIIYTITGGCGGIVSAQSAVTINPNAAVTSVTGTSPLCITATSAFTANGVVPGGGTGAWSSSNPAVATVTAAGLVTGIAAGTCNIIYTITGGCGGTVSAQSAVTINPNAAVTSVTGTSPLCITATSAFTANGVVPGGGTGAWSSSNPAVATVTAAGLVTGVSAGTCNIIYTITGGCGVPASAQLPVTINANAAIASVTGSSPLCIAGAATFTANGVVTGGGTGAWSSSNPAVATVTAAGLVTGVAAGTCNIIYTITGGCGGIVSAQQALTVNPNAGVTSVTGISPLCIGGTANYTANGVILSGGTGAWSSSNPAVATVTAAGLVTGISAGTCNIIYTITGGCGGIISAQQAVTINPNAGITSVTGISPLCIGGTANYTANGAILSGGTGAWSSSNPAVATVDATGSVTAVSAGSCNIIFTITGGCGGIATASAGLTVTNTPVATISYSGSPWCTNEAVQSVTVTGTSGGSFSALPAGLDINALTGDITPSASSGGTYTVTYTMVSPECGNVVATTSVTINQIPSVIINPPAAVCSPSTVDLTAAAITSGSDPGLTFTYWTDVSATISYPTPAGATAGTYYIKGTDGAGCYDIKPVTVVVNPQPAVNGIQTNLSCAGASDGSIDITVSSGTSPYTFAWTGTGVVAGSEDQSGLAAGVYSVIVTDAAGCNSASAPFTLTEPPVLTATAIVTDNPCPGGSDGSIDLTVSGGTAPYSFLWSNGATVEDLINLTAGNYNVTVTDAGGCTATNSASVEELSGMANVTDISCNGANDGSIDLVVSGGSAPVTFLWSNGATTEDLSGLSAGNYSVTISDADGCTVMVSGTITEPAVLTGVLSVNNILCHGDPAGSIDLTMAGGTTPYSFLWDNGATTEDLAGVQAGDYNVTVTDARGCIFTGMSTITEPPVALSVTITSQTDITCEGAANGSVTVTGSGGILPHEYSLNGGPFQVAGTFTGLGAMVHTITIRDANLCTDEVSAVLAEPAPLTIDPVITDASCPEVADGSITLSITGGTQPYSILWADDNTDATRTGLLSGTYSVAVTDMNGCAADADIVVDYAGTSGCLEIPTIITPNTDGYNDTWIIKNIDLFPDAEVFVYNRWGELVFHTKNLLANQWDGTLNGKQLPTDSYHYIIQLKNGSGTLSGVISIIR
jgi:gliding motility-associated-like protein